LQDRVDGSAEGIRELQERSAGNTQIISGLQESIAGMTQELGTLQAALAALQTGFTALQGSLAQKDAQENIGEAIGGLREETNGIREAISGVNAETNGIREEIGNVRTEISNVRGGFGGMRENFLQVRDQILAEFSKTTGQMSEASERNLERSADGMESLKSVVISQIDQLRQEYKTDDRQEKLGAQLKTIEDGNHALEEKLSGVQDGMREGYHKECVKVYRNVQAAFIEENGRQTELLKDAVKKSGGKQGLTLTFAILAFVMSLGTLAIQVLTMLKILP
ncbi:MAG: hypothetical protein J6Q02_06425, partial [Lachnospiraceae bacterium]|nr:hypothetical protein [Lachnospiraceae bacterium]